MSGRWAGEELEYAKSLGWKIFKKPFKLNEIKKWLDGCEIKPGPYNKLSDLPIHK